LDRRLGETQSRYALCGEEKILDSTGTRTPTLSVVQIVQLTDCAIPVPNDDDDDNNNNNNEVKFVFIYVQT
jgi:hypothetical protein